MSGCIVPSCLLVLRTPYTGHRPQGSLAGSLSQHPVPLSQSPALGPRPSPPVTRFAHFTIGFVSARVSSVKRQTLTSLISSRNTTRRDPRPPPRPSSTFGGFIVACCASHHCSAPRFRSFFAVHDSPTQPRPEPRPVVACGGICVAQARIASSPHSRPNHLKFATSPPSEPIP